ncbi:MAG: GDP-L-fucose synthase [Candidatus Omnitrophica bacterium]|nr:GDP-L-fucose synthase [Candidatus Omnitrophota bacterium]
MPGFKHALVTGGNGFLGRAVVARLKSRFPGMTIEIPRSNNCDLRIWGNVEQAVQGKDLVIHLAGRVGGIGLNRERPGELFYDNLIMGAQLIEACRRAKVRKMVVVGTVCSYPKFCPAPFREESIWEGYPEETNAPYGIAKKALMVQMQAYREQYGMNSIFLIPVNLYGPGDNFEPSSSHVIPALIRKISEAKATAKQSIKVWGDGSATREFLYVDEAAEAIVLAVERYEGGEPVNLGSGQEISIKDLVLKVSEFMGYAGKFEWDPTKPNGQPRRLLDVSRAERLFAFRAKLPFVEGLRKTIDWYEHSYKNSH